MEMARALQGMRVLDLRDARMAAWTVEQTPEDVLQRLQAAGVPSGIVKNARDLVSDPQLLHRQHYLTLPHAAMGESVVDQLGFRLSRTPGGAAACRAAHGRT